MHFCYKNHSVITKSKPTTDLNSAASVWILTLVDNKHEIYIFLRQPQVLIVRQKQEPAYKSLEIFEIHSVRALQRNCSQ